MRSILIALGLCIWAIPARATVLVPADLSELAREAQVIARGSVVSIDAQWTDDRRTIETVVTLETESYLKGQLDRVLQFKVPGGTLGRFRNIVVGAPQFEPGQRIIVFLGTNGPRLPHLLGLTQGVYRVNITAAGAAVVSPSPLMPGTRGPIVRGLASRRPALLGEFEQSVRAIAGGGR